MRKKSKYFFYIFIGIFLAIIIKLFVFDIYKVEGTSMQPNFYNNQIIYVNKLAYGIVNPFGSNLLVQWKKPQENDVVIFYHNGNTVIKRCLATENDLLEYSVNTDYNLIIKHSDGTNKDVPLNQIQYHLMEGNYFVPKDTIFVVGDNYHDSLDSRNYGFVSCKNILGKVICKSS